jgi:hypothetical protein
MHHAATEGFVTKDKKIVPQRRGVMHHAATGGLIIKNKA